MCEAGRDGRLHQAQLATLKSKAPSGETWLNEIKYDGKPKATWVEPSFIAELEYRDITSEGLLRQSSFKALTKRN
jgi:ATP-dependent DNA ligase